MVSDNNTGNKTALRLCLAETTLFQVINSRTKHVTCRGHGGRDVLLARSRNSYPSKLKPKVQAALHHTKTSTPRGSLLGRSDIIDNTTPPVHDRIHP